MNEQAAQGTGTAAQLSRLNDVERRVLRLLAEGHTVKSIASLIGSTSGAVNERLREARRKTGVGSSRELARLLRAQENRDEELGVAAGQPSIGSRPSSSPRFGGFQAGVMAMCALGLVAVAGAFALASQGAPSTNEVDPIIGASLPSSNPAAWHATVRKERRDPEWAPRAEQILRARFALVSHIAGPNGIPRVTCATSICEVAGIIEVPEAKADRETLDNPVNRTMRELQGKELHDDLLRAGLEDKGAQFTSSSSNPARPAFFIYFSRVNN